MFMPVFVLDFVNPHKVRGRQPAHIGLQIMAFATSLQALQSNSFTIVDQKHQAAVLLVWQSYMLLDPAVHAFPHHVFELCALLRKLGLR